MKNIPLEFHDLLSNEKKAFAYLATTMPDGSPQVTPVWFSADDEHILINSAEGRIKDKNMRSRANIALCIADPANPYRYLQIRGKVVEIASEGADAHIDALAFKYRGVEKYPNRSEGEKRVIYKILPVKINAR